MLKEYVNGFFIENVKCSGKAVKTERIQGFIIFVIDKVSAVFLAAEEAMAVRMVVFQSLSIHNNRLNISELF